MRTRFLHRSTLAVLLLAAAATVALGGGPATGDQPATVGPATAAPDGPAVGEEIAAARTAMSRTFVAEHGALRTRFYGDHVNFKDASGTWQKIDNTLVTTDQPGYAYRNRANSWDVDLPPELGTAPVRVRDGSRWVSFSLDDASGPAETNGNSATYANAVGSVDVSYLVLGSGVKETLKLPTASATNRYSFSVRASGGLSAQAADGRIDFVDGGGHAWFSFARPSMRDAAGEETNRARFELRDVPGGWDVELVADRDWLDAPERQFPIEIDPTTMAHGDTEADQAGTNRECHIVNGTSADTSFCANQGMQAGFDGTKKYRALMQWTDIHNQIKRDSLILDAKLSLYADWIDWGNNATWNVHRLTRGFTTSATWNKYDGTNAWTSAGGDFDSTVAASKDIANTTGWHSWRITDLVQDWASGTYPNLGLMLKQASEAVQNRLDIVYSDGGSLMPRLDILYVPRGGSQPQYTFQSERLTDRSGYGVNVANGNLLVTNQDVSIPGTGPALNITRSYNSVPGGWQGFGAWEMNTGADIELQELENGDVVFWGPNAQVSVFRKKSDGTYTNPTGLNAKLEKDQPLTGQWRITYLAPQSTLVFNSSKKLIRQQDRNGNDIQFTYDANGYLSDITDTQDRHTTFTVGGTTRKMIETITDPAGRVHTYSYPNGFLTSYTDPDGGVTTYDYEPTGQTDRLKQITDPRGNKTTFAYTTGCLEWQNPCRVTSIKRWKDASTYDETTFSYNDGTGTGSTCKRIADNNPDPSITGHTIVTDPRGYTTTYCWDREMRVVFTKDQEGNARKHDWTANSNVTKYTMGSGAQADVAYDNNRVSNVQAPQGSPGTTRANVMFDYTGRGQDNFFPANMTDSEGRVHDFTYTTKSNLTQIKERSGTSAQVKIEYNDNDPGESNDGTVRWSEDGRGNRTNYGYDTKGNLTSIDPPDIIASQNPGTQNPGTIQITYNTNLSRIATMTDGKGQRRDFTYDPLDRVTQIKFYNPSNTLVRTDTYTYDKNGNRLTRVDASGSYSYVYDALNRMTQESRPGHSATLYSYDGMSNLSSITADGDQTLFTYYPDNVIQQVKEPVEGTTTPTTTFQYDSDNTRTSTTFPNGVVETITPDGAERPKEIKATKGATVLTDFKYTYLRSGDTKERALKQTVEDVRLGRLTRYTYDALSRIYQATTTVGTTTTQWAYQYDNASNLTTRNSPSTSVMFVYNEANELCWKWTVTALPPAPVCSSTPAGRVTYGYDANGDLVSSSGGLAAAYNVAKQTTDFKPTSSASNTTFEYAGEGQAERTKKNSTIFLDSVLGLSTESTLTSYVRDNTGALVGMRVPVSLTAKKRFYYLRDALGSVVAVTNDQGAVVRRHVYGDPYGEDVSNDTIVTGAPSNPYRFAGEYFDTETSLYKMGERYYDPTLARWTQRDPMMQAFSPRQANGYSYVGGDPVNLRDPRGEFSLGPGESFLNELLDIGAEAAHDIPAIAEYGLRFNAVLLLGTAEYEYQRSEYGEYARQQRCYQLQWNPLC